MKRWSLITTYKIMDPPGTNFRFMESFVDFYERKWGVEKSILLVGVPKNLLEKNNSICDPIVGRIEALNGAKFDKQMTVSGINYPFLSNINILSSESGKVDAVFYHTDYSTKVNDWSAIKNVLSNICDSHMDKSFTNVINIDNDEFLRMEEGKEPTDNEGFHYVEFIPPNINTSFDWESDMSWCAQPWYYRKNKILSPSDPKLNSICHNWCKKFNFSRQNITSPWIHSGQTKPPDSCSRFKIEDMKSCNIAYHLACLDYEHYKNGKAINHYTSQTGESYDEIGKHIEDNYKLYYQQFGKFTSFVDNFIKK